MRISYNKCDHCGKQLEPHIDWIDCAFDGKESFRFDLCDECPLKDKCEEYKEIFCDED